MASINNHILTITEPTIKLDVPLVNSAPFVLVQLYVTAEVDVAITFTVVVLHGIMVFVV